MHWLVLMLVITFISSTETQQQCVNDAELNEENKCVCKPGFKGDGTFCCVADDHDMCMVIADPIIYTMNGDLLPMDLPCPTMMSEIHTMGPTIDETVLVYSAGDYGRNGQLNYDFVRLEYSERYNDIHTEIEIHHQQLYINGVKHDKTQPWSSPHEEIEVHYSPNNNTFTTLSMGTTQVMIIRPNDKRTNKPGICIAALRNSLLYGLGMCNQRKRGLQRSSINKGFHVLHAGIVEHVIRRMPLHQRIGPDDVLQTCTSIYRSRRRCRRKWNPAIKACFILVSDTDIRLCLSIQRVNILHAFEDCIKAQCGNESSCARISRKEIKTCVDIKPDCTTI